MEVSSTFAYKEIVSKVTSRVKVGRCELGV